MNVDGSHLHFPLSLEGQWDAGGGLVFIRLRNGLGASQPAMGAALGTLDQFFNPGAARARELLDAQHERVVPTPSPGDKLLEEGRIVICVTATSTPACE